MPLEVYQCQVVNYFFTKRTRQNFYFSVDNTTFEHPHRVASSIVFEYTVTSDWLFFFSALVTSHAFFRRVDVRRIRPDGGPSSFNTYGPDEFPGRGLGAMLDNFTTADLQWHFPGDITGKHQVRVGPLAAGAYDQRGWHPLFILTAQAFAGEHLAVHTLDVGLPCQGCINHETTGGTPITNYQLGWPPGRQENRRLRF